MRINRETLLKIARDTTAQRTRADRGIQAVYLSGALLEVEYLLGRTADIDLTFIHIDAPDRDREIQRLSDEVHLDIAHHASKEYRQARKLRVHPWLGPTIFNCKILYDPQHFMDFTQASVRGQFDRVDYVMSRARQQAEHARQIWFGFSNDLPDPGPKEIGLYLRAVDHAANAVASLSGIPLTERRFLVKFPARAEAVERPGLYPGLLGLLGAPKVEPETIQSWLPAWQSDFTDAPTEDADGRIHPDRLMYYLRAFEELLKGDQPYAVLWPMLRTWTLAAGLLPGGSGSPAWREACTQLELLGEAFEERVSALDAYLDMVEETLDKWGRENGVFT